MPLSFYKLLHWSKQDNVVEAEIELDPNHPLFKGHFPEMPILPGACMVQLTHHLVDKFLDKKTTFVKAANIKFLIPVNPLEHSRLKSVIKISLVEGNGCKVEQQLSFGPSPCFKFSATYRFDA